MALNVVTNLNLWCVLTLIFLMNHLMLLVRMFNISDILRNLEIRARQWDWCRKSRQNYALAQ